MSPERSVSPQDEAVQTPKMSVPASPVAGTPIREAQSPISLLLAVAQSQSRTGDDDLTNLAWLHEKDVLKGMNIDPSPLSSVNTTPVKYNNTTLLNDQLPPSDYVDDSSISASESLNSPLNSPILQPQKQQQQQRQQQQQQPQQQESNQNGNSQRNKHPHNIPYDPLIHTNNKPPYSFSCLIFMAIESSVAKALPVKEIYAWISEQFPYFKTAAPGWRNSVRHNLSLNKCFQKIEKDPQLGKGSLWVVDQQYKPNLIQALTRSPFHPCSKLLPTVFPNNNSIINNNNNNSVNNNNLINNNNSRSNTKNQLNEKHSTTRLPNPELYPYLSRKLAATEMINSTNDNSSIKSEISDESLNAVDAAAVMLSLKNGPRYRQKKEKHLWQVITTSPSQDHTYSAADTIDSNDTIFESDDERIVKSSICRKIDFEDEEERKIKEGAETLLNLAGIAIKKRRNSDTVDYDPYKRIKLSPTWDINDNEHDERSTPFKPRLLRTKKKELRTNIIYTNNNNNNNINNDDEWIKHRRELERNQQRIVHSLDI